MLSALLLVLPLTARPALVSASAAGVVTGELLARSPEGRGGGEDIDTSALGRLAQGVTVRLEGATSGSGVLVGRDGDLYTVLTAWHVVRDNRPGEDIAVITPDGLSQPVQPGSVRQLAGIDLAMLRFRSERPYRLAPLGRTDDLVLGSALALAGFPSLEGGEGRQPLRLKMGLLEARLPGSQPDGYQLLYSNDTLPGMSGGPVLNSQGELVGIHGRAELHAEASRRLGKPIASSTNMGLTIDPYLAFRSRGQEARTGDRRDTETIAKPLGSLFSTSSTAARDRAFTPSERSALPALSALEQALSQGEQQRADQLTRQLLLAEPGQGDWLTPESVERLRCPLLLAVDTAWRQHSQQRFGFSIQRSLWPGDFQGFATLAGWRRGGFVQYVRGNHPDLPPGYFPRRVADGPILQHLLGKVGRCLTHAPLTGQ